MEFGIKNNTIYIIIINNEIPRYELTKYVQDLYEKKNKQLNSVEQNQRSKKIERYF